MNQINILIPMSGLGTRFSSQGYALPKPLIDVLGVPMIEAVVKNLNITGKYIFVVQKQHKERYDLESLLNRIAPGCSIIEVDGVTDGAARSALMASDLIDNELPLVIANSDQIVEWDSVSFVSLLNHTNAMAMFHANDPKWSYAKINDGLISQIAEKEVISNDASVGIYGWCMGKDFVRYANLMILNNTKTNNEFYIAPTYNEAIADGKTVTPFFVDKMYGIGTPEDLRSYISDRVSDAQNV